MSKPRVLLLNHNFKGEGTYLRCFNIGRELARRGYEIDLVCASSGAFDVTIKTERPEPGIRVLTLPRLNSSYIGYGLRAIMAIPMTLLGRYDIIHSFAVAIPSTSIPSIAAGLLSRKKLLIDWDDVWAGGLAGFATPMAARVASYFEKNTPKLARACGITVVSDYLEKTAKSLYPDMPVYKVLNGSNTGSIEPVDRETARKAMNIPKDEVVLLSMGRTYTRSFEILLSTFARVLEKRADAKLYMVGKVCEYGLLKEYVRQTKKRFQGIMDKVVFTGGVEYEKLKYPLSAADMLLLPMEDCPHDIARFPIRFGDYLASGNLIVSNAVGEIKALLEKYEAGITAHPRHIDDFAEKIVTALEKPEANNGYGTRARNLALEDLSWKSVADGMDAVYQAHLGN